MGDTCSPGRATAWGEDSHQFHCPSGGAPSGHRAMATAAVAASVTATVTAVAAAAAAGGESGLQPMQAVGGDGRQADAKHLRNRFQPQQQQQHHKRQQPSQHHHQQQHPQLRQQQQQQLERQQNTQQGFEHDQRGGQAAHPLALDSDPLKIQGQDVGGDSAPKRQRHHRHANNQGRGGGKRHRRKQAKQKRPRRWKPYTKLSWDEKRQLEERDARRAARIRAEMEAKGFPVAPYNTTQFLMEEHYLGEPDLKPPPTCRGHRHYHHGYHRRRRRRSSSCKTEDESSGDAAALGSSSSSGGCSGDEGAAWAGGDDAPNSGASDGGGAGAGGGGDFLLKDFFETYERYHTESLNAMSKRELLQEYLELEKCLSRLQEENALLRLRVEGVQHGGAGGGGGGGAHGSGGELGGRGGGHAEATAVACKGPIGGDGGASVDGGGGGGASDVKQDVSGAADGSGGSEDAGGDVGGGDRDDGHAGRVEGDADATEAGDGGGHEGPSSSSSFPQPQVTCWTPQGSSEVTRIVQLESELQRLRADNAKLNRQHELLVQLASTGLGTEAQMA